MLGLYTQSFIQESAVSKLCELLQNVLLATFMRDMHFALHFPPVACISKLSKALENLLAGYLLLTGKRVTVYFEETSTCLLKNLIIAVSCADDDNDDIEDKRLQSCHVPSFSCKHRPTLKLVLYLYLTTQQGSFITRCVYHKKNTIFNLFQKYLMVDTHF